MNNLLGEYFLQNGNKKRNSRDRSYNLRGIITVYRERQIQIYIYHSKLPGVFELFHLEGVNIRLNGLHKPSMR